MEPGGQGLHSSDPAEKVYLPGLQALQSLEEDESLMLELVPATHNVHKAWPSLSAYDPALQPLQMSLAMVP